MNKKILTIMTLLLILMTSNLYSRPRIEFINNPRLNYFPNVVATQIRFDANNIDTWIQNTGIFDQDIRTNNTPGFMWPKGSNKFAIFTAGLSIGTKIEGQLRLASASYKGEYAPSTIPTLGGAPVTNSDFKLYKVTNTDSTSADYLNWDKMVPYGAPYVDRNNNGTYEPGIDRPGIKDAVQTVFVCLTDAYQENHTSSEGFSGGTPFIRSEMRVVAWAYSDDGINDMSFLQFTVINKNDKAWDSTFFGFVVDTDLGIADDDYIGCDTLTNLGYCYNADNDDGTGNPPSYGQNPPSSGMDFFLSPWIPGAPTDSVVYYDPPGSNNRVVKRGFKELGMTSFVYFTNTGSGGIPCEQDPSLPIEAYRYLNGIKKDGSSWFHPNTGLRVNKLYPGEPETFQGWTERGFNGNQGKAVIKNCLGGDTVSSFQSPPGDRRFIFNSGSNSFTVNPGDTQKIVLAQMIARGSNNLNAVTRLKGIDVAAQKLYNLNFAKLPSLPLPTTNISVIDKGNGRCNLILNWDDKAESYFIYDSLFQGIGDSSYWKFEGYEIYQIKDVNQPIPDFYNPETMNDNIKLLKIYDIKDTVGLVYDRVAVGNTNPELPVVPPYLMPVPEGFPNTGINRSIALSSTAYPDLQNGESNFVYGRTYYFAVIAYAYKTNPNPAPGTYYRKIQRNPISISTIIKFRPETPLSGTQFTYRNSDTLLTNRRDLGVEPVIINQALLLDAKYRIVYSNLGPSGATNDTTYSILRSFNGGQSWDTLKRFLKYNNSNTQDSSRIIDGVLINVKNIPFESVIVDPTSGTTDSIKTKLKGWDYLRNGNPVSVFQGSRWFLHPSRYPYQSQSMGLSYPTNGTFNNGKSQLSADFLRKVRIDFTDPANGQYAYRYYDTSKTTDDKLIYRDTVMVPFKVYSVDSTTGDQRQLNCALVVSEDPGVSNNGQFIPTSDSLGNKILVVVFNTSYDGGATTTPYKVRNLYLTLFFDIMYIWAPRLVDNNVMYAAGDQMYIYPYTKTRPFFSRIVGTTPLWYDFETKKPTYSLDQVKTDMDKIRVVPNPYYGYNDLETSTINRFVTFRHLPATCVIKLFTIDGVMIKKITKDSQDPTITWDLKNAERIPVASGMYIALIDVPGVGQKVMKLAIFMPEERIDVR